MGQWTCKASLRFKRTKTQVENSTDSFMLVIIYLHAISINFCFLRLDTWYLLLTIKITTILQCSNYSWATISSC